MVNSMTTSLLVYNVLLCHNIVPSHSPLSLVVLNVTSTTIELDWEPPPLLHRNGVIGSYIILCSEIETNETIRSNSSTSEFIIRELHPYYNYECKVSAVTVGVGPFSSTITVTTLQDGENIISCMNF